MGNSIIIVDGPDGCGKTTLCRQLAAEGYTYQESPRLRAKGDAERMKYETSRYLRLYGDGPHVVDRLLFSEMAYGPVLRGKSVFTLGEYLVILQEIQFRKIFVIFCLPEHRYYKPDESPYLISKLDEVAAKYAKIRDEVSSIIPRVYTYDWEKPNAYIHLKNFLRDNQK